MISQLLVYCYQLREQFLTALLGINFEAMQVCRIRDDIPYP